MRIKRLEELRKIHLEMKERDCVIESNEKKCNENMILTTMKRVMELNSIARREGLLALEEAVEDIPLESVEEELKQLIILIVDGTDPDVISGIGMARYYVGLYTDYEALRYFIYLEGALSIQAGDNPRVVEEKLKAMLPPDMYLQYSKFQVEERLEEEKENEEHLIENLCKGERLWNSGESGYYVSKLVDYVICDVTDKELQRMMREVDNSVLALAMKGMSGDARKHIFSNLSERLGKLIAKDMVYMGPVRAVDIVDASQKILGVLMRLIDNGEIGAYEYLQPFYSVFNVDTKSQREKNTKISQLRKMVEEYEQGAELVREVTDNMQM